MRPIAIGRRNWTFAGSNAGGERAAAIYSLIETTKLHGLDLQAYLRHVLEHIADYQVNVVSDVLPWNNHLACTNASISVSPPEQSPRPRPCAYHLETVFWLMPECLTSDRRLALLLCLARRTV